MEKDRPLTGLAIDLDRLFTLAAGIDSQATIRLEHNYENIDGLQENGHVIKILRPLVGFEEQIGTRLFTVLIDYPVTSRGHAVDKICREFFFIDGKELEVSRQADGETYRQLGPGEVSDIASAVANAKWL